MSSEIAVKSEKEGYQLVVFKLGNENYAVLINLVREVISHQAYTRIPDSPGYIKGVINLRGSIIPVIDGRKKFNLETCSDNINEEKIMIIDTEDGTVGLIVDSVSSVIYLKADSIEPPPVDLTDNNEIFWGIGKYQDKLLILIDCYKSLSLGSEINDFKNMTELVKRQQNAGNSPENTKKSK